MTHWPDIVFEWVMKRHRDSRVCHSYYRWVLHPLISKWVTSFSKDWLFWQHFQVGIPPVTDSLHPSEREMNSSHLALQARLYEQQRRLTNTDWHTYAFSWRAWSSSAKSSSWNDLAISLSAVRVRYYCLQMKFSPCETSEGSLTEATK